MILCNKRLRDLCVCLDLHTEAVHAALAKYKERKMPMPSKRRSVLVQSSVEAFTPPGEIIIHYPELTWALNRTPCYPQPIWTLGSDLT